MNELIKQKREEEITGWLKGKTITEVNYFLMNRDAYLHPGSPQQLVDAGVELQLDNTFYVTFGWNFEFSILDMHKERFVEKRNAFNNEMPFIEINVNEDKQWKKLLGKTIVNLKFAWNWFIDIDENTHYVPQDIEIELNDNGYAAICTTAYTVDESGINILHPDSEGELLVLFDSEDTRFYKRGSYYEPVEQNTHHGEEPV
jgi:hypothetical protein